MRELLNHSEHVEDIGTVLDVFKVLKSQDTYDEVPYIEWRYEDQGHLSKSYLSYGDMLEDIQIEYGEACEDEAWDLTCEELGEYDPDSDNSHEWNDRLFEIREELVTRAMDNDLMNGVLKLYPIYKGLTLIVDNT